MGSNGVVIHLIAAARPNFMKIAPLYHELKRQSWAQPVLVHTGQHYDLNMSDVFFRDLGLPEPDLNLGVGSGTHAQQTGRVMIAYEKILLENRPDLIVVVGDVNSTMAATLAGVKLGVRVAHLEAGLRSFDRAMPEEINRLVTDSLADFLWTPSPDADENLMKEGIPSEKIQRVGNIMIDSLEMLRPQIEKEAVFGELGLESGDFALVTLHRPSNVDCPDKLKILSHLIQRLADKIPLVFPLHPRTRKNLDTIGRLQEVSNTSGLTLLEPLSYIRFMNLVMNSRMAITDSGGIQEETSYLGVPCLTLRPNTERPITVTEGTNTLCTVSDLEAHVDCVLSGLQNRRNAIDLWDGQTAPRVVQAIASLADVEWDDDRPVENK